MPRKGWAGGGRRRKEEEQEEGEEEKKIDPNSVFCTSLWKFFWEGEVET